MLQRNVVEICGCARSFGPFLTTIPVCTHKCACLKKSNAIKLNANSLALHCQEGTFNFARCTFIAPSWLASPNALTSGFTGKCMCRV